MIGNPMEPGGRVPLHGGFTHLYTQCSKHAMIRVTQHTGRYEITNISIISLCELLLVDFVRTRRKALPS
jgi:hypothetical protein